LTGPLPPTAAPPALPTTTSPCPPLGPGAVELLGPLLSQGFPAPGQCGQLQAYPLDVVQDVVGPAMTVPVRRWVNDETSGDRTALAIGGDFEEGPLEETWSFGAAPEQLRRKHRPFQVRYARKTLSGWLNDVVAAGSGPRGGLRATHADEATAEAHPEVADTRIAPFFLIVRARRP